jgi:hypothetical protein
VEYETIEPAKGVIGASGVVRHEEDLLIVSDDSPGCYFRVQIPRGVSHFQITEGMAERCELFPGCSSSLGLAVDLESIDVLADGRIVVLSERLRSIIDDQGIVAQYDDPFAEFAEKGLEGLAVRPIGENGSRIAVVWEGGSLDKPELPDQFVKKLAGKALKPVVYVHDLPAGAGRIKARVKNASTIVELRVPSPEAESGGAEGSPPLRFRAPDLVWHEWTSHSGMREWGFIVLLNSETPPYRTPGSTDNKDKKRYGPRWLQRFDMTGKPVGSPLDLDTAVGQVIQNDDLKDANWEGVAWFDPGKQLVLVHDVGKPKLPNPSAVILSIPSEWQT